MSYMTSTFQFAHTRGTLSASGSQQERHCRLPPQIAVRYLCTGSAYVLFFDHV